MCTRNVITGEYFICIIMPKNPRTFGWCSKPLNILQLCIYQCVAGYDAKITEKLTSLGCFPHSPAERGKVLMGESYGYHKLVLQFFH